MENPALHRSAPLTRLSPAGLPVITIIVLQQKNDKTTPQHYRRQRLVREIPSSHRPARRQMTTCPLTTAAVGSYIAVRGSRFLNVDVLTDTQRSTCQVHFQSAIGSFDMYTRNATTP